MFKKILLFSCASIFTISLHAQKRTTSQEYIEKYKNLAVEKQEVYGIPASITMAQGLLESDCGNSRLAVEANNHFGIKCKKDWTGMTISHDDDAKGECFRKYASAEESYRDHSEFLDKSPRYAELFKLEATDYKNWAHGLKKCGYATNPKYAELLIKIIEENKLYLLDTEGTLLAENTSNLPSIEETSNELTPTPIVIDTYEKIDVDNFAVSLRNAGGYSVYVNNGSEFVIAKQGDTYSSIAHHVGVSEKKLRKYNDVSLVAQPEEGSAVYIRPKMNKASNGKLIHITKEGETLHSISQQYGIKLKKLAKLNRIGIEYKISSGQQIRLM